MAEDKYFNQGRGRADNPATGLRRSSDLPPSYDGPTGVVGAIASYSRRRAISQYKKELLAIGAAYRAGAELNNAREAFIASQVRLGQNNLEKIALREEAKITAELAEEEIRLATALRRQDTFTKEAELEDKRLANDSLYEDLRRKELEEKLFPKNVEPETTKADQRCELEREIDDLFEKLEMLDAEYVRRSEADTVDEAYENSYNTKRNRFKDRLDKKIAQEEAL